MWVFPYGVQQTIHTCALLLISRLLNIFPLKQNSNKDSLHSGSFSSVFFQSRTRVSFFSSWETLWGFFLVCTLPSLWSTPPRYISVLHIWTKTKSVSVQHGRHSGSPGEWGDSGPPQAKAQCDAGHCQGEDIEGYLEILRDIVEAGIGILSRWEYWGMFRDFEEYFQGRKQYHVCKMLRITTCYGVTR